MGSVRGRAKSLAFRRAVLLVLLAAGSAAQAAGQIAVKAEIGGDGEHTRYVAFLSKEDRLPDFFHQRPLSESWSICREADIQVPAAARGLVLSSRSGRLAAGKSRIVIDLAGPAVVEKSGMLPPENGLPARLVIELVKIGAQGLPRSKQGAASAGGRKAGAERRARRTRGTEGRSSSSIRAMEGLTHGAHGHSTGTPEKDVTLDFSRVLKEKLEETGKYRIIATRTTDDFVALDERARIASEATADLLISIHADCARREEARREERAGSARRHDLHPVGNSFRRAGEAARPEREQGRFESRHRQRAGAPRRRSRRKSATSWASLKAAVRRTGRSRSPTI